MLTRVGPVGILLLALALSSATGCTTYPARGPVADFFMKDYDLPPYEQEEADFQRRRRIVAPGPATGALGGVAGAFAGGRLRAWRVSAGGSLGGLGGAAVGWTHSQAEHETLLPETYELFSLGLPIIATDPNTGVTLGLLPVAIFKEGDRITNILAPDVTFNEIQGVGGTFRMRRYFSRDATLAIDAGSSSKGEQDYEGIYSQRRVGPDQTLFYRARFAYRTTLAERFYGLGNETEEDAESTYVFRRTTGEAVLGIQLPLSLSLELRERVVSYKLGPGRLSDVVSTRVAYPEVKGVRDGRVTILAHQVRLAYDTRDSFTAPTEGVFAELFYEVSDSTLGSDIQFQKFSGQVTVLLPKLRKRLTTAARLAGWYVKGDEVPFWELTQLGGKETHRGYGQGRFVAQNGWVLNVEERFNAFFLNAVGTDLVIQFAGFLDLGRVYEEDEALTLEDLKLAVGGAVRLVVPDSELVTSIDLGISDEGTAVFVGLDYPF